MSTIVQEITKFNDSIIANVCQGRNISICDKEYRIIKRSWCTRVSEICNLINYAHSNFDNDNIIKNFYETTDITEDSIYKLSKDIDNIVKEVVDYNYTLADNNIRNKFIAMVKINILAPAIMKIVASKDDRKITIYNILAKICNDIDIDIIKRFKEVIEEESLKALNVNNNEKDAVLYNVITNQIIRYKFGPDLSELSDLYAIKSSMSFIVNNYDRYLNNILGDE